MELYEAQLLTEELKKKILFAENTENFYPISGKRYYISNSGSDANDGVSPETAFATPKPLSNIDFDCGDAVLFQRGSIFRITDTIWVKSGVTYGSYGEGAKPKLYTSPANYAAQVWNVTEQENIWQADFNYEPASGIIFNDGEDYGTLKHGTQISKTPKGSWYFDGETQLVKNGDFYHDYKNGKIYLYCDKGNPTDIYTSIEIMPSVFIFRAAEKGVENIVIDNLCMKYVGGFAVSISFSKGNISVTNCEIGYVGGLYHVNCMVRYGNAIEFWEGYHNITVKNNWIYETYDSAITWQGRTKGLCDNIYFCDNLLEYNNSDIEFFEHEGSTLKNFVVDGNIMRFTNAGWGTRIGDSGVRSGIEGCLRGLFFKITNVKDVVFSNNIMYYPYRRVINSPFRPEQLENIKCQGNKLYFSASHRSTAEVMRLNPEDKDDVIKATNPEELEQAIALFDGNMEIDFID